MNPLQRILTAPVRAARGAWAFIDPQLKAGRIPFTRTILVMFFAGALIFVGYTLTKKGIRMPFAPEPYEVQVILPDAAGLDPSKEPAAGVAGASAGKVTEVVYEDGQATATLELDSDMEGKIFADATASLRPINVLQVLIVNVHPGSPESGRLPEGQVIEADRTDAFVGIDELTSILDADTQAQVQVLIAEAAIALKGREPELRKILERLGELTDEAKPVARALDERRRLLTRLVDNLDVVFTTLGDRGDQLAETIDAGSETLAVTAAREPQLAEATRRLAPTVQEAQRSIAAGRRLADPLVTALDQVVPVADNLRPASAKVRELIPRAGRLLDAGEKLADDGAGPVRLFERGTRGLAGRVKRDLIPAIDNFAVTIAALDKFKGGIAQTADLWSQAFSLTANNGIYTQVFFGNSEMTPEGLGLGAAAALSRGGKPSRLQLLLSEALERTCATENLVACELRFKLPQLPVEPVTDPKELTGGEG